MNFTNSIEAELWLPRPRDEVFHFFADVSNLEAITPEWLSFKTITPLPVQMKAGALIDHRIKLHGFPLKWRTEIAVWQPPHRFVDRQLRGPYQAWVHEHTFHERDGGTLVRDHVDYSVFGGKLVDGLFVRADVERIFAYRTRKLLELFAPSSVDT